MICIRLPDGSHVHYHAATSAATHWPEPSGEMHLCAHIGNDAVIEAQ